MGNVGTVFYEGFNCKLSLNITQTFYVTSGCIKKGSTHFRLYLTVVGITPKFHEIMLKIAKKTKVVLHHQIRYGEHFKEIFLKINIAFFF